MMWLAWVWRAILFWRRRVYSVISVVRKENRVLRLVASHHSNLVIPTFRPGFWSPLRKRKHLKTQPIILFSASLSTIALGLPETSVTIHIAVAEQNRTEQNRTEQTHEPIHSSDRKTDIEDVAGSSSSTVDLQNSQYRVLFSSHTPCCRCTSSPQTTQFRACNTHTGNNSAHCFDGAVQRETVESCTCQTMVEDG